MDQHRELFRRFGTAFMNKDADAVGEFLTEDFVWCLPDGKTFNGKEAALQAMRGRFADTNGPQFSASRFEYYNDTIVQSYKVSVGGRTLSGADVYQVRDGLIAHKDAFWKQLGGELSATATSDGPRVALPVRRG